MDEKIRYQKFALNRARNICDVIMRNIEKKLVAFNEKTIEQEFTNSIMIIRHCFNRYTDKTLQQNNRNNNNNLCNSIFVFFFAALFLQPVLFDSPVMYESRVIKVPPSTPQYG